MVEEDMKDRTRGFRCRVIADHRASFPYKLVFSAGDTLAVEERETVWDGWSWCVDREGRGAWVPDGYVERHGDSCILLREYDSNELTVGMGDILEAGEKAGGWLLCTDREGRRGWVPASCVEPCDEV
jgi:hypothetical protein